MATIVKEEIEQLKSQWKMLWRDRFDDKVRAEGVASRDYPMLEVERGLVVVATRDYTPPDFADILKRHNAFLLAPSVGGWGKFIKDSVRKQKKSTKRYVPPKPKHDAKQQNKKGGRGWLHV